MANVLDNAVRAALASRRAKPPDSTACWSCGSDAVIRDPCQPHTVRCGMCGTVRQILVELPTVAHRVATERQRHGGGPRVVG